MKKYLREENLVEQMKGIIQKVSLPDDWANNMLAEIDKEKEQVREETKVFVQNLQTQKVEIENKAENLLDLFIGGKGIEPEEYQAKIILSQSDNQEIREFLKNIGSNFILKDKKFHFALKIG